MCLGTTAGRDACQTAAGAGAGVAAAWALVSDIARIGEFSPECVGAQWLDGAAGLAIGARFEGTNRVEYVEDEAVWIRPCTVTGVVAGVRFSYTVGDRYDGTPAREWEFLVADRPDGCVITQTFRHLADGLSGLRVEADARPDEAAEVIARRSSDLRAGMRQTLERMRGVLEPSTSD
jgi:Polyketide cyclase / dehydrase and lipid transport